MKNEDIVERAKEMFVCLSKGKKQAQPSKMWEVLNRDSMKELQEFGYENFKTTLVRHYFANTPLFFLNRQIEFLVLHTNPIKTFKFFLKSIFLPVSKPFSRIDFASFTFLTYLIWEYVRRDDSSKILEGFEESLIGNPPRIYLYEKLISQDIANSVLEYKSIFFSIDKNKIKNICEIGAGSGRDAEVFIRLLINLKKYIIIDIPPALALSEQYLTDIFPNKKIFRFREFKKFSEIEKEFKKAEILFFLPSQIEFLPPDIFDLTINISSFHEMKLSQIKYYFKQLERLTKKNKYLFIKEWKVGHVSYEENETIRIVDYPRGKKWTTLFQRTPKVQIKFFEELMQLSK